MKKKLSRIISVNILPPLISLGLLSAYTFLIFIPRLEAVTASGGGAEILLKTLFPFTMGILGLAALVFIFSTVYSLKIEISREKIKKSYNIVDREYQNFIEATSDGFIHIPDTGLPEADDAVLKMTGYTAEKFSIMKPSDIINDDTDGRELLGYIKENSAEITGRYETRLRKADGSLIEVLISASRIRDGKLKGAVLIVKDMSDEARTNVLRLEMEREYSILEYQSAQQYIYRPAGSMMERPLICSGDTTVREAAMLMSKEKRNTFIVADASGRAAGIVTDQDLRERVITGEVGADASVEKVMSSPIISAGADILFFEAFRKMRENSIRQLLITDESGMPVGLLTEKKLLQVQSTSSAALFAELEKAENREQLRDCYQRLAFSVRTLVQSGARAENVTGVVSVTAELITAKLGEIVLSELPPPPAAFAFLAMGSEGRGEQTLFTDQDNAIVFADPPARQLESCRTYFTDFGRRISEGLNYIGYRFCKGGVMASNPLWVRSESEWKQQIRKWLSGPSSGELLDINIFLDFKPVFGEAALAYRLRESIREAIQDNQGFLTLIAAAVSEYKPPLNAFGNIRTDYTEHDDQVFDIKKAIAPLVVYARTRALKEGIRETGTISRLKHLVKKGVLSEGDFRSYEHACNYLTLLRFRDQVQTIEEGAPLDNLIYVDELLDIEIITLRNIFKQISAAQNELRYLFTGKLR